MIVEHKNMQVTVRHFSIVLCCLLLVASCQQSESPNNAKPFESWPSEEVWHELQQSLKERLVKLESPFDICKTDTKGDACQKLLEHLKNPFWIEEQASLTQAIGYYNAWESKVSPYAVFAESGPGLRNCITLPLDPHNV